MEKTEKVIGDDNKGLMGVGTEQNNTRLSSDEEHLKSENEFIFESGNSNKADLGSDSPTENLTSEFSIQRSQSLHSITSSIEIVDNRSRSYVDLHCMGDGAVDFSVKQHGSDSEGKVSSGHRSGSSEKGSPEYRSGLYEEQFPEYGSGLYGQGSPEHGSGSYGIHSPEHRSSLYGERSPERGSGSCGILSPERGSGSDGRISPKHTNDENIIENSPTYNVDSREELDREIVEEEDDNIKRIKDWINQIDINSDMIVEDPGESSGSGVGSGPVSDNMTPIHAACGPSDPKTSVGMAMAYNYISAMNPVTASAQLSNLGLVAVPILSAFAGLRELNLSGNNICMFLEFSYNSNLGHCTSCTSMFSRPSGQVDI